MTSPWGWILAASLLGVGVGALAKRFVYSPPTDLPMLELAVGIGWAITLARLGITAELPGFLAMAATLVVLSAVDLEQKRIPNRILGPMSIAAVVLLGAAAIVSGRPSAIGRMGLGALAYFTPMLLLGLVIPESLGMGDIKLAGYLGWHLAWFSLAHVLVAAFLGFLIGAVIGLVLVALRKKGRKDFVPFGPSLAAGAFVAMLLDALPRALSA